MRKTFTNTISRSNKNARPNLVRGFTLIEITIAISIMGIILSLGLLSTFDSLSGAIFRSERENIATILERARSRSINNYYESSHGVCLDNTNPSSPNYVLFRNIYSPTSETNEYTNSNKAVSITSTANIFSCANGGIAFSQISGKTNNVDINISENARVSTISVNSQGRINW
ncbi:MAG: type II secretion system protein [Minisyncoccia bacterium]